MPRPPHQKGYHKPKRSREQIRKGKPEVTLLRGYTGCVTNLWFRIDDELKRRDWNWGDLAERLKCKRQYLDQLTSKRVLSEATFYHLCAIFGWTASEIILREMPTEDAAG